MFKSRCLSYTVYLVYFVPINNIYSKTLFKNLVKEFQNIKFTLFMGHKCNKFLRNPLKTK